MAQTPLDISVIVPCRNEEKFIRETIRRISEQEGAGNEFSYEVFIVDGMSNDRTCAIVEEEIVQRPHIRLLRNREKVTPSAFNLGIRNASGRYICILGAHAEIANDYLLSCLRTMRRVDADNVGGPWKAVGRGYVGKAIALAFQSPFAVGGVRCHKLDYEGCVDTVWGGFYKREVFDRIGLFDEEFIRNQDDELNLRLVEGGGKIWQSPQIRYSYYCRESLKKLWLQYFQWGYWKVKGIMKHRKTASLRHLVPGAFVLSILALSLCSMVSGTARTMLAGILGLYALTTIGAAVMTCSRQKGNRRYLPIMPLIFAIYHVSYGWGFLRGIWDFIFFPKEKREVSIQITR